MKLLALRSLAQLPDSKKLAESRWPLETPKKKGILAKTIYHQPTDQLDSSGDLFKQRITELGIQLPG